MTSPLSMNAFLTSALSLSNSYCFLLLSLASLLACLSNSFCMILCSADRTRFSFLLTSPTIALVCASIPFLYASFTIYSTFISIDCSSFKNPLILSISHGRTLSCRDFSIGRTITPEATMSLRALSFKPTKYFFATTLATCFLCAALRSSLRAFC